MHRRRLRHECGRGEGRLIGGLMVVMLGVLFLLDNLGFIYVRDFWQFWPMLLVVFGLVHLTNSPSPSGRILGGIWAGAGIIFLAHNLGYIPGNPWAFVWPLILILYGILMLARGLERSNNPQRGDSENPPRRDFGNPFERFASRGFAGFPVGGDTADTIHQFAILSGSRRRIISQDFQGGEILAIFGGVRLDLRQANSTRDEIYLDVNALFGGVDIRVPESWSVSMRGTPIVGGFEDSTRSSPPGTPPKKPNLIITGMAAFGGITVKN
jgi:predicted membrane protein